MLTEAQKKVYSAVLSLSVSQRRTPKLREIAAKVGVKSTATVHKHIKALVRKGWLLRPGPHELEIVSPGLRNGSEWHSCDRGHARCWFQVPECPACRMHRCAQETLRPLTVFTPTEG